MLLAIAMVPHFWNFSGKYCVVHLDAVTPPSVVKIWRTFGLSNRLGVKLEHIGTSKNVWSGTLCFVLLLYGYFDLVHGGLQKALLTHAEPARKVSN